MRTVARREAMRRNVPLIGTSVHTLRGKSVRCEGAGLGWAPAASSSWPALLSASPDGSAFALQAVSARR